MAEPTTTIREMGQTLDLGTVQGELVKAAPLELYHAMSDVDDALIRDDVLHGQMSNAFVYSFEVAGKRVTGISVVGARHLARHYGKLKHKFVASVEKTGRRLLFRSYDPPGVQLQVLDGLEDEPDFYECLVEVVDVHSGNSIQTRSREDRHGTRQDGSLFDRPNFTKICDSKAYRNAVLALCPQDVQEVFKQECLKAGKVMDLSANAIEKRRAGVLSFATKAGLAVDRRVIENATWAQLDGLSSAARDGSVTDFERALDSLGGVKADAKIIEHKAEEEKKPAATTNKKRGRPRKADADKKPAAKATAETEKKEEPKPAEPEDKEGDAETDDGLAVQEEEAVEVIDRGDFDAELMGG